MKLNLNLFFLFFMVLILVGCSDVNVGSNVSNLSVQEDIVLENYSDDFDNFSIVVEGLIDQGNKVSVMKPKFIFGFGPDDFLIAKLNNVEIFNSNSPQDSQSSVLIEGVGEIFFLEEFEEFGFGTYEVLGGNLGEVFFENVLEINFSDGDDGVLVFFEFYESHLNEDFNLSWSSNLNSGVFDFPIVLSK